MEINDIAQAFYHFALTIALVIGGVWAFWKWKSAEEIRKKESIKSVESEVFVELFPYTEDRVIATITSVWTNLSKENIFIDTQKSYARIYVIENNKQEQALKVAKHLGNPLIESFPYQVHKYYRLDASSKNRLQTHFVDIPVILTPHSGHIDPLRFGFRGTGFYDNITVFFLDFLLSIRLCGRCGSAGLK